MKLWMGLVCLAIAAGALVAIGENIKTPAQQESNILGEDNFD